MQYLILGPAFTLNSSFSKIFALTLLVAINLIPGLRAEPGRVFDFGYEVTSAGLSGSETVDIYVPIPPDTVHQRILDQSIEASHHFSIGREERYGNTFFRLHRPAGDASPIRLNVRWRIGRRKATAYQEGARSVDDPAQFLSANARVPVNHPILQPIRNEIYDARTNDSASATARAIYNWVVDNVEYKKVGNGWGNGDTFWACNERYGNCTDFHALFTSLARSEQIPARFEIGFPIPEDRPSGDVAGYHCWVQFYLPDRGWVPIDASEAFKFPAKRELFFGTHPIDRIHFTVGRDLIISRATAGSPLNYFIYPHIEVGGRLSNAEVATRFWYQDVHSHDATWLGAVANPGG